MESTSEPMKIHISETTHELLGRDYSTADRGEIVVKGKGTIQYIYTSSHYRWLLEPFCIEWYTPTEIHYFSSS